MSENLTNIDYGKININIVHLYNYFNQIIIVIQIFLIIIINILQPIL